MSNSETLLLPDIGDFDAVEVIEIHVAVNDQVEIEAPLITLESDKATMDIPSAKAGKITKLHVNVGDKIAKDAPIVDLKLSAESNEETAKEQPASDQQKAISKTDSEPTPASNNASTDISQLEADIHTQLLVLGGGPGGYTAAFRAADLGQQVTLVERYNTLGGVCLNVGCIPSKALLHIAKIQSENAELRKHGLDFQKAKLDPKPVRQYAESVITKLTGGLSGLAKQRKVDVVTGVGKLLDANRLQVQHDDQTKIIAFEKLIIAAGSQAIKLPFIPEDDRVWDSTDALLVKSIPERLLILGGGIIGLEMATVYHALGSKITVVEMADGLIPGADKDIVRPLQKHLKKQYENIYLSTSVTAVDAEKDQLTVHFDGKDAPETAPFDAILVAVGRAPNGSKIGAENAQITVTDRGFIPVNDQQQTNQAHIFAIGDIVGQPMLAHKATHEAKVAAEVCAGHKSAFVANVIPSVAYTDPEVAWVGPTEAQLKADGVAYGKGLFPWAASGRSLALGRDEGITKVLFNEETGKVISAAMVGPNAGELVAEAALAIEMGCDAEDIALTIHPHPTLSESFAMATEVIEGTVTDIYAPKK